MTFLPQEGSFVESGKPPLTKEEYIEMMKKKGFHFDKKDEPRKYWIVTKITTKCPVCSREYEDNNERDAKSTLSAVMTCATCGFEGDLGL
jgi:hypothetical protein